jgi:hypothetical protein
MILFLGYRNRRLYSGAGGFLRKEFTLEHFGHGNKHSYRAVVALQNKSFSTLHNPVKYFGPSLVEVFDGQSPHNQILLLHLALLSNMYYYAYITYAMYTVL